MSFLVANRRIRRIREDNLAKTDDCFLEFDGASRERDKPMGMKAGH